MTHGEVRRATPADVSEIVAMVRELAEYEKAPHEAIATEAQFTEALFGEQPAVFAYVIDDDPERGTLIGFALYFLNFSTWLGRHGIYLEDLYVRPQFRGHGYGKQLLATLAKECVDRGFGRLEWWVLDWNEPALEVYRAIGAVPMDEWTVQRVSGAALDRLAAQALPKGEREP